MIKRKQRIVTIGGGTGSFTLLSGLKQYPVDLSAIVSMADDGGSTGVLRDELGILPPGDVRQCLVALSESSQVLRELFNYRYTRGTLSGHSFGNIFLSTLEKITGSFDQAVKEGARILRIHGKVIPVTLTNIKLIAKLKSGKEIIGQCNVEEADLTTLEKIILRPKPQINPEAVEAVKRADKIIINPGTLYSSIIPNFLVEGLSRAVAQSQAKKIYICNLMTKLGHTDNFTVLDYISKTEEFLGKNTIDYVIYNKEYPDQKLLKRYARKGEYFVASGNLESRPDIKFIGRHILSHKMYKQKSGDKLKRTLVRHDSTMLAKIIYNL